MLFFMCDIAVISCR